ncbi:hypothetical protein IP70_19895 [alpha proteobacterium AAP38]|nr:hypothetical protein IP70_19895 [alpha proteobacterium AAP38]
MRDRMDIRFWRRPPIIAKLADAPPSWTGVRDETAREILRQGEAYLAAQLQCAIAADQRAMTMATMYAAFATGLIGGGATLLLGNLSSPIGWGASAAGTVFLAGCGLLTYAARPIDFHYAGAHPAAWFTEEDLRGDLVVAICESARLYQRRIERNDGIMDRNGKFTRWGSWCAFTAPLVGALTFLAVWAAVGAVAATGGAKAAELRGPVAECGRAEELFCPAASLAGGHA